MPSPEIRILRHFLSHDEQFVSGSILADDLGVSRVSIRNYFEKLKECGFSLTAIRNKGYRLDSEPDPFNSLLFSALYEDFTDDFPGDFTFVESIHSTNSLAEQELSTNRPTPFLIIADHQSAGRGRRGRVWHSPEKKNIYLSFAFRPNLPPARLQTITLWIGMQICLFLRSAFQLKTQVKWPNDILVNGRKIAGILTEARVDSDRTRDLVLGIGMNINLLPTDFPEDLRTFASSLAIESKKTINISRLCHQLAKVVIVSYNQFISGEYVDELARLWPSVDFLKGKAISTGDVKGTADGITSTGSLRLKQANNAVTVLHSGEVSLCSKDTLSPEN